MLLNIANFDAEWNRCVFQSDASKTGYGVTVTERPVGEVATGWARPLQVREQAASTRISFVCNPIASGSKRVVLRRAEYGPRRNTDDRRGLRGSASGQPQAWPSALDWYWSVASQRKHPDLASQRARQGCEEDPNEVIGLENDTTSWVTTWVKCCPSREHARSSSASSCKCDSSTRTSSRAGCSLLCDGSPPSERLWCFEARGWMQAFYTSAGVTAKQLLTGKRWRATRLDLLVETETGPSAVEQRTVPPRSRRFFDRATGKLANWAPG